MSNPEKRFHQELIVYVTPDLDERPAPTMRRVAPARYIPLPSIAYRLALVAAGEGVATFKLKSVQDFATQDCPGVPDSTRDKADDEKL